MTREEAIEILCAYGVPQDEKGFREALDMAIEALQDLSKPNNGLQGSDLISRTDALKPFCIAPDGTRIPEVDCDNFPVEFSVEFIKKHLLSLPSAEPKTGWIPVKWHEITDEEREREGYPKDWVVHIDCDMPCDGDEILVQTKQGYIRWDVCYEEGEFSLDSGWDWIEDIVAWMPMPELYKERNE